MTYCEVKRFLDQHTDVVELADGAGARVAVCPAWVGRVMTSTCGGPDGPSFGYVNRGFIEYGKPDPKFSNYGGEERMWLSPEGGQFSLWFKQGVNQTMENWFTPASLNEGAWKVTSAGDLPECRMETRMTLQNASGTELEFDVARDVRLLDAGRFEQLFGVPAAKIVAAGGIQMVAYETVNAITNRGADMTPETGLVSIWILGMLNPSPETVVVVPYRPGKLAEFGPVVKTDYFGQIPPQRIRIVPEAVLFLADSQHRSKIGTSQRRARNVLGSIDFAGGTLTVAQFTMPEEPAEHRYMNNMWQLSLADPYTGDVANSYNDGPSEPGGGGMGSFYEIESLSPAAALTTGQTLEHCHRTVHLQADPETLSALSKAILGIDLPTVRAEMVRRA